MDASEKSSTVDVDKTVIAEAIVVKLDSSSIPTVVLVFALTCCGRLAFSYKTAITDLTLICKEIHHSCRKTKKE